jgi:cation diffusion facilitator CzcD-associated flavoprotein CzcO
MSMSDETESRAAALIIGAGFGGIGLGIRLKHAGLTDFIILEKSDRVGGVWRTNRYPGAACDVPSLLYSFSFAPRAGWPDRYARQTDILAYLELCVRESALLAHIRFDTEVTAAGWDEAASVWVVRTRDGATFKAPALISATGQLDRPFVPRLPGLEQFGGPAFHSAQWRHDVDLAGKRVAVIGTGASAIQFVPQIAPQVEKLTLFQRSAAYVLPKSDKTYAYWQQAALAAIPGALWLSRAWQYLAKEVTAFAFVSWPAVLNMKRGAFRRHLERSVKDAEKRRRLTPDYRIGCKRVLLSNEYYPALDRPNVEIATDPIAQVREGAIVTADGRAHPADCIIFGTGFAATDFLAPMRIVGRAGRDLRESWREGASAYLGITVAGFPNFFMLYGPNTGLAHNSIVFMLESQIGYVVACLKRLARGDARRLDVRPEAQQRFNARLKRRSARTVWMKGCTSWYLTAAGENATNWPGYTFEYAWRTRAPRWTDYDIG